MNIRPSLNLYSPAPSHANSAQTEAKSRFEPETSRATGHTRALPPSRPASRTSVLQVAGRAGIGDLPPDISEEILARIPDQIEPGDDIHLARLAMKTYKKFAGLPQRANEAAAIYDVLHKRCEEASRLVGGLSADSSDRWRLAACRLVAWVEPKQRQQLVEMVANSANAPVTDPRRADTRYDRTEQLRELEGQSRLLPREALEALKSAIARETKRVVVGGDAPEAQPQGVPSLRHLFKESVQESSPQGFQRLVRAMVHLGVDAREQFIKAILELPADHHLHMPGRCLLAAHASRLRPDQRATLIGEIESAAHDFEFKWYAQARSGCEHVAVELEVERRLIDLALQEGSSASEDCRMSAMAYVLDRPGAPPEVLDRVVNAYTRSVDAAGRHRLEEYTDWGRVSACLWKDLNEENEDVRSNLEDEVAFLMESDSIFASQAFCGMGRHLDRFDERGRELLLSQANALFDELQDASLSLRFYQEVLPHLSGLGDAQREDILKRMRSIQLADFALELGRSMLVPAILSLANKALPKN